MITLTAIIKVKTSNGFENITIDRRNLLSMSSSITDRSDFKLPSFGIISNVGRIEFSDHYGDVLKYADDGLLISGLECEMFINNTLYQEQQKIATLETDQWDYDNDNKTISVTLKDDLEEWQDINVEAVSYDARNPQEKPLMWVYEHLWAITNQNYTMPSSSELDNETKKVLNETYMQYPLLESGSLWQQWTKLCQACQLHIYKNSDGVVVCRYNGGN